MFEQKGRIIRDGKPLEFEYVPEVLIGRQDKTDQLETQFRPLFFSGSPCNAYLHGHVGSGKTVTARLFCREMTKAFSDAGRRLDTIYVNCRIHGSEYAVMLEMVRFFDKGFPDRGFSVDEMFSTFKRHVISGLHPVVVILDEVDVLLSGTGRDTVYQLTRASEGMPEGASISLLMISQKSLDQISLDAASRSTFGRSGTVEFERYGRSALQGIVRQRVSLALYPGVIEDEVVDLVVNNAEPYGDARMAIEVLRGACTKADGSGLTTVEPSCVQMAGSMERKDYSEKIVSELNLERKIVLLSVARSLFKRAEVSMPHAEGTYAAACEEYGIPVKKHTQYYSYLQDLEHRNLIHTEVRRGPEGGRVTYISILNTPPKDLAEILESLIDVDRRRGESDEV